MSYLLRRLLVTFLTSVCQYALFGVIFLVYIVCISWANIPWILIVSYTLIPILSAWICCFIIHRNNFRFDSQNMVSKASVYRLAARLLSVFCFLLIGYIVDRKHVLPIFISNLLNRFGEYAGIIESVLNNFFFYIIIAIFPLVYALVEYLFVSEKKDYSGGS